MVDEIVSRAEHFLRGRADVLVSPVEMAVMGSLCTVCAQCVGFAYRASSRLRFLGVRGGIFAGRAGGTAPEALVHIEGQEESNHHGHHFPQHWDKNLGHHFQTYLPRLLQPVSE